MTYKSEDEQLLEKLNDILKYNDEHDHNTTLAKEHLLEDMQLNYYI